MAEELGAGNPIEQTTFDVFSPATLSPEIQAVLNNPNLTMTEKRKVILRLRGVIKERRKYGSEAERQAAKKKNRDARRARRREEEEKLGIAPKPRVRGRSEEEKKRIRSERGKARRATNRELEEFAKKLVAEKPDLARKMGLDIDKIRKALGDL